MKKFLFAFLCLLFGAANGVLMAQQVFGSIYGTVTDNSGAAVANAKIVIVDVNKSTRFEISTNESGNYTKGQLIPGVYRVEIEAPGFGKVVSSSINVAVDQAARFDAALNVGNVTEQIEVTAAAPLLQTDRADVAQTFSSKEIKDLPNFGRNLQAFELLSPGTASFGWNQNQAEDPQGGKQIQVNGQPFSATGFELDGTTNQDPILGEILINPNMDSVTEVRQGSQVYDAEFGYTSGGIMTYSTKSGSNGFHGSAFEYLYLNTPGFQDFGRNPFEAAQNNGVPTVRWNQFGGSIGGRVIKNKLFFFGDAQLTRRSDGQSVVTTVPTAAARTGDLSAYLNNGNNIIFDPATGDPKTGLNRIPFANNTIPGNRLSPQALALLNYFPLPNTVEQGSGLTYRNNYSTSGTETFNANQWDTRWDYYLNEKNTFFGRYSYSGFTIQAPGAFGAEAGGPSFGFGYAGNSDVLNQSIAGGWTHVASSTLTNELRFGYMRYRVNSVPNGVGTSPAADAGIPGLNLDNYFTSGMPAFFINGDPGNNGNTSLGYALNINSCNCPLAQREQQYQVVDNVSKIFGNHSLKFGADIRYAMNLRVPSDAHRAGELTFAPGYTGDVNENGAVTQGYGLATFLLGQTTSFRRYVSSTTDAQERQKRWFFYGQDAWRATQKLTITYGLRWELIFPETVNAAGNGGTLDLRTGNIAVFGLGNFSDHGIMAMNYHNFAPRLAVAYQLTPKTVVRAGSGWSYNLGTFGSTFGHNVTQNIPVLAIQSLNAPQTFSGVFNLADGPAQPTFLQPSAQGTIPLPNGVEAKVRPLQMTLPMVWAYNLTVERQLSQKVAVTAAYVGNQGRHTLLASNPSFDMNTPVFIPGDPNINDGRPFYGKYGWTQTIDDYCNCANNGYNSFQATVKIQQLRGYSLQGSYTYQVAKGDGYGDQNSYTFLYNRSLGWGNEDYIPHNQLTLAQSFDIPYGRGRKYGANISKLLDYALGGWNISGVTTYYSGLPFTPTIGSFPSGYARPSVGPNDRPDLGSGDPYAGAQGNRNQWFVGGLGSTFLLPTQNTFGNYPVNSLYGPHFVNQDLSLAKSFALTERFRLTLRGDAANVFNHTNLGMPNANVTDQFAGQITGLAAGAQMRRLQFSGRIDF
jgi:hypothetical protein